LPVWSIYIEVVCTSSSAIIWQLQFTQLTNAQNFLRLYTSPLMDRDQLQFTQAHQLINFSSFINLTSNGSWPASSRRIVLSTTLNETLSRPPNQKIGVDLVFRSTLYQIVGKEVISYLPPGFMSRDRGSRKQGEQIKKSSLQSS
jgi:hypothetical protein